MNMFVEISFSLSHCYLKNMDPITAFFRLFRPFLITITVSISSTQIGKSVVRVLGI